VVVVVVVVVVAVVVVVGLVGVSPVFAHAIHRHDVKPFPVSSIIDNYKCMAEPDVRPPVAASSSAKSI